MLTLANAVKRLIMLLISADVTRSSWTFISGVVNLSGMPITTHSSFCQASGYFIQVGIEQAGKKSQSSSRSLLTSHRSIGAVDSHTHRSPDLSTLDQSIWWSWRRDWSIPLQARSLYRFRHPSRVHVLPSLHQRETGLCGCRNILCSAHPAILVSTSYILDTSLRYHVNHSQPLSCHLRTCCATVQINQLAATLPR